MNLRMSDKHIPLALVALYIFIGIAWSLVTPTQELTLPDNLPKAIMSVPNVYGLGPDEKEHQLYIQSIANGKGIPAPDLKARRGDDSYVSYQAQHPPLFYAVMALPWSVTATAGNSIAIQVVRILCVLFGALTGWMTYCIGLRLFAGRQRAILMQSIVLFTPMFGHMTGNISNEPMAMALVSVALYKVVSASKEKAFATLLWASLCMGLAIMTRLTAAVWLPGFILLLAQRNHALRDLARSFSVMFLPLILWIIRNQLEFGKPIIRTFHRPLLDASHTFVDLAVKGITIDGAGVTLSLPTILLWVAGCSAIPMWLMQFNMPIDIMIWSLLCMGSAVAILIITLNHMSAVRRGLRMDATREIRFFRGVALSAIILAVGGLLQQLFFSDWDVVFSTGRYSITAVIGGATLVTGVVCGYEPKPRARALAISMVVALVCIDAYSVWLVRQFYTQRPTQDSIQYVEK